MCCQCQNEGQLLYEIGPVSCAITSCYGPSKDEVVLVLQLRKDETAFT